MCSITCSKGIQAHPRNFSHALVLCWVEDIPVEQCHWKHWLPIVIPRAWGVFNGAKCSPHIAPFFPEVKQWRKNSPSLRRKPSRVHNIYCIRLESVCVSVHKLFSILIKVRKKSINFKPGLLKLKIAIALCYTLHYSRSLRRKHITVNNILCLIGKL